MLPGDPEPGPGTPAPPWAHLSNSGVSPCLGFSGCAQGSGPVVTGLSRGRGRPESGGSGAEGRRGRGEQVGPGPAVCESCSGHG